MKKLRGQVGYSGSHTARFVIPSHDDPHAADSVTVDEEERGAVYAQAVAFLAVGFYLRFEAVGVFGGARDVQVQLLGFGDQVVTGEDRD